MELIISIAILAMLASLIIFAFNPERGFKRANNAERLTHVSAIGGALNFYAIEHNGAFPSGIDSQLRMLGTAQTGCDFLCSSTSTPSVCLDIDSVLTPDYLNGVPMDPETGSAEITNYAVQKLPEGIRVVSCTPALDEAIESIQ